MKLCFIDLETTGLYANKHGIHQASGLIVDHKLVKEADLSDIQTFNFKLVPFSSDILDPRALAIGGVDEKELANPERLSPEAGLQALEAEFAKHINKFDKTDKMCFYGYNVSFDEDFLRGFYKKQGNRYFGSWFWTPSQDVMRLCAEVLVPVRSKLKNFKLATVAEAAGLDTKGAHDATVDIRLTFMLYQMLRRNTLLKTVKNNLC